MYQTQKPIHHNKHEAEMSMVTLCKSQQNTSNVRSRSASANVKFGSYKLPDIMFDPSQNKQKKSEILQNVRSDQR